MDCDLGERAVCVLAPRSTQMCGCVKITSAGLAGTPDGLHTGIAKGCQKLRRLLLRGCIQVGDEGVEALATYCTCECLGDAAVAVGGVSRVAFWAPFLPSYCCCLLFHCLARVVVW